MQGRPPKPAERREFEGNPGKRAIRKTPRCAPLKDEPPSVLGEEGLAEWKRVFATIGRIPGLLQEQDRGPLIALCLTWEQFLTASALVSKAGPLVKSQGRQSDRPSAVRNPAMQVARDCLASLLALWSRFGMTPSDRTRLAAGEGDDERPNPLAEVLEMTRRNAPQRRRKG